jgi:hypothetical protein
MTDTTTDPYALSSGLIDDFDGEITEAYFGTDANYNSGDSVLLILELKTNVEDKPSETLKLSCGSGWAIENGGRNIVKEQGKAQFNKNSRVGLVLGAAIQAGALDVMKAKGSPLEAATWQGLAFHWERVDVKGFDGETKQVLLPTRFLGGATAAKEEPALSPALQAKLLVLAKNSADFGAFVDAALEVDGVTGSAEAIALVTDEGFFNSAKG